MRVDTSAPEVEVSAGLGTLEGSGAKGQAMRHRVQALTPCCLAEEGSGSYAAEQHPRMCGQGQAQAWCLTAGPSVLCVYCPPVRHRLEEAGSWPLPFWPVEIDPASGLLCGWTQESCPTVSAEDEVPPPASVSVPFSAVQSFSRPAYCCAGTTSFSSDTSTPLCCLVGQVFL